MPVRSPGQCIQPAGAWPVAVRRANACFVREETGGLPGSWGIPVNACPGLGTPAAPNDLAVPVVRMLSSARLTASTSATVTISELNPRGPRPRCLRSPPPVARREARLATGLPATALAGLDSHQLDSFERF